MTLAFIFFTTFLFIKINHCGCLCSVQHIFRCVNMYLKSIHIKFQERLLSPNLEISRKKSFSTQNSWPYDGIAIKIHLHYILIWGMEGLKTSGTDSHITSNTFKC